MAKASDNSLGNYLKNRRERLDPEAFGFQPTRRRTPGLRREEVAQRANVSATWYTWLEQGRGGTPSASVLDGIATALDLNEAEREHLFLLAEQRPPRASGHESETVTPHLQRVLDSLPYSPAIVKTAAWDVVAWNRAASVILTDYSLLPPGKRNILRLLFGDRAARQRMQDWETHARIAVAAFRTEAARTGASTRVKALVEDLTRTSADFAAIWRDHDVVHYGEGRKRLHHATGDIITVEYSSFVVDGSPDLGLIVFTASTPGDAEIVRRLVDAAP